MKIQKHKFFLENDNIHTNIRLEKKNSFNNSDFYLNLIKTNFKKYKTFTLVKCLKLVQNFVNLKEKINVTNTFKKITSNRWKINFLPSSINKYTNVKNLKNTKIYYLRKNRIFNKSRYSRNRQLYRTGVYWCLWLSIFIGWGLYFILYRFTLNFGYLWWLTYLGLSSFFFNRLIKYRFYNIKILYYEVQQNYRWLNVFIIHNIFNKNKN